MNKLIPFENFMPYQWARGYIPRGQGQEYISIPEELEQEFKENIRRKFLNDYMMDLITTQEYLDKEFMEECIKLHNSKDAIKLEVKCPYKCGILRKDKGEVNK